MTKERKPSLPFSWNLEEFPWADQKNQWAAVVKLKRHRKKRDWSPEKWFLDSFGSFDTILAAFSSVSVSAEGGGRGNFSSIFTFLQTWPLLSTSTVTNFRVKGSIQFEFYEVKTTRKLDMGDMTSWHTLEDENSLEFKIQFFTFY